MIKKYVGVFSNLRVCVIYKKYRPKKENSYKVLKRLKYVKQRKMRRKTRYKYPSRAYLLLTDIPQPWAFIACIRHAS